MLNELHGAELHGVLERALRRYVRAELLVIDDFAVLAMDAAQAKLAFQVISERYDYRRSTCITTNRPFKDWPKVFPDALNAQVIAETAHRARRALRPRERLPHRAPLSPRPPHRRGTPHSGRACERLASRAPSRRRQDSAKNRPPRQRVGPWVPVMPLKVGPSEAGGDTMGEIVGGGMVAGIGVAMALPALAAGVVALLAYRAAKRRQA